jgi:CHAT domain-containing protein
LEALARADRIRLLPQGALERIDLHALPVDGAPLLARAPVYYGLDLPAPKAVTAAASLTRGSALIVADPTADLPGAAREEELVAKLLSGPRSLLRGQAQRAEVLAELERASLFHFAGHAQFAGLDGMSSELRLADGALSVGDVLSLSRAPELVFLSACEGARADVPSLASAFGLAQAFVAAGARAVVAPTRPIADDDARALVSAFYEALASDPARDAPAALRRAVLSSMADGADLDAWNFRVLEP